MKRQVFALSILLAGTLATGAASAQNAAPPADQTPVVALGCQGTYFVATNRGWVLAHPHTPHTVQIGRDGSRTTTPERFGPMGKPVTQELIGKINEFFRAGQRIRSLNFTPDCRGWSIIAERSAFTRNVGGVSRRADPSYFDAVRLAGPTAIAAAAFDPFRYNTGRGFALVFSETVDGTAFPTQPGHVRAFARPLGRYSLFLRVVPAFPATGRTVVDIAFMPLRGAQSGFTVLASDGTDYTNAISTGRRVSGGAMNVTFDGTSTVTYSYTATLSALQRTGRVNAVSVSFAPDEVAPAYEYGLFASNRALFASPQTFRNMSSGRSGLRRVGTARAVGPIVGALSPSL